jgi:hypothetical protein
LKAEEMGWSWDQEADGDLPPNVAIAQVELRSIFDQYDGYENAPEDMVARIRQLQSILIRHDRRN